MCEHELPLLELADVEAKRLVPGRSRAEDVVAVSPLTFMVRK